MQQLSFFSPFFLLKLLFGLMHHLSHPELEEEGVEIYTNDH